MLGTIAILLAVGAAGWLLLRTANGASARSSGLLRFKIVGLLAIAAVLFAARLFPLALMILLAAGAITAIELWSSREIREGDRMTPGAGAVPALAKFSLEEAAATLGVSIDASDDEVKAAHKRLIGQLHPDKGGSDYLAAKINDARNVMLERRAPSPAESKV